MTAALAFECGCPDCGGTLAPLACGLPSPRTVSMMLQCIDCRCDVQVAVVMDVTHRPQYVPVAGCGKRPKRKVNV